MSRAAAFLLLCLAAGPAAAGLRIDAYASEPGEGDGRVRLEQTTLLGGRTVEEASFETGAGVGGGLRVVASADEAPWLLALDAHGYSTDNCCLDVTVLDLALSVGVRANSPWLRIGGGGLHPYLLGGVDFAMVDGDARTATIRTGIGVPTGAEAHVGNHVGAGIEWQASPTFGLFLEYRRTSLPLDSMTTNNIFLPTENTWADGRLEQAGFRLGASWRLASPGATRQDAPPAENGPAGTP